MSDHKTLRHLIITILAMLPGTRQLIGRIRALQQRVAALEARQQESQSGQPAGFDYRRQVDLVDFGPLSVFMYTHDLAYQNTHPDIRNTSVAAHLAKQSRNAAGPEKPPILERVTKDNLLLWVFNHYWEHEIPFVFLDIGCQYGSFALYMAYLMRLSGRANRVVAFDPGIAADLVPYNIELNGFENQVQFERLAVGSHSLPSLIFTELGHSENNRAVNRDPRSEYESYVVRSTTVDDYLAKHAIGEHPILKVDTQGGEPEVWQGMRRCLSERVTTALIEYTPHALASRVAPLQFLQTLAQDAYLIDVPPGREEIAALPGELETFVATVDARPEKQTDILVLPKKLPGAEALYRQMTQ